MTVRWMLIAAIVCVIAGCGQRKAEKPPAAEIVKTVKAPDAPLTVTVKVDRRQISIADTFHCTIEIKRGKDLATRLPEFAQLEQSFAPLLARERRALPERIENGLVVEGDDYELEPLTSGACTIKPVTVTYTLGDQEHSLATEAIELAVTSLGADDPRTTLRDIAGPVALARRHAAWWVWALAAAGVIAASAAAFLLLKRRKRRQALPERRRAAHEIAFEALRALREKDYIGRGLIGAFYVELSAILRWYIENRFGLHAPEQTTEEFLDEIARDGFFDLRRRTLLKDFLGHCDLVKFATYGPTPREIQGAFESATTFIDETKEAPASGV
jgi:hypothetical protein